jgi:hypothetical protein
MRFLVPTAGQNLIAGSFCGIHRKRGFRSLEVTGAAVKSGISGKPFPATIFQVGWGGLNHTSKP